MHRQVGLWIDHRRAVLVLLSDAGLKTLTLESGVEARVRMAGGARSKTPYGPQDIASESKRDARHAHHLDDYYDRVAAALAGAESVLIMGPGEARTELKKKLEATPEPARPNIEIEPADKLTEAQVVERVRQHFGFE